MAAHRAWARIHGAPTLAGRTDASPAILASAVDLGATAKDLGDQPRPLHDELL